MLCFSVFHSVFFFILPFSLLGLGFPNYFQRALCVTLTWSWGLGINVRSFSGESMIKRTFIFFYLACMSQLPRTEKVVKIRNKMHVTDWNFRCVLSPGELSMVKCVQSDEKWHLKWPLSLLPTWIVRDAGKASKWLYYTSFACKF